MTALEDQQNKTADSPEQGKNPARETETLGVLLVHGIGSQNRGDTLVHCATALHSWMRDWLERGWFEKPGTVDLVDVSIAEAGPDHPAQARIIFRRGTEISKVSWLIAESCWFETYRRPGFYEFVRWALWVLPVAIIIHFVPAYWRIFDAFNASNDAEKTRLKEETELKEDQFLRIKRGLGPAAANKDLKEIAQHLSSYQWMLMGRLFGMHIKLALAALVGIVVQLLLAIVAVIAIIPGITRSFAGWVQRKISATIGDSFLFVTSPITGAAVFTRVKKDLDWLLGQCDRVIVLAHSQGAAVSYRVIEREFWEGPTSKKIHALGKIHALVTYGSGLRKLFDLEMNIKAHRLRTWILVCIGSIVPAASMAALITLFLSGIIPWWIALPGLLIGVVLEMAPLVMPQVGFQDPELLPIPWYDLYSSHDPVPNGPTDVVSRGIAFWFKEMGIRPRASARSEARDDDLKEFHSRLREVINRRSTLGDHTSYWSGQDDFVARIVDILAKACNMPIYLTFDQDWQKVSRNRRLWRVTWLSRCRAVAALVCLSILFWPRPTLEPAASRIRELTSAAAASLPEKLAEWTRGAALVPDWLTGAAALALATYLMFLVALAGWTLWEKQELARFFRREPHSSIGVAGWVFALGWLGVLVSAPGYALAHVHSDWGGIFAVLWAPFILAVWSTWMVYKSERAPGTPLERGRIALARAEEVIANKERDRTEALRDARFCFLMGHKYLGMTHSGSDEWVRAVVGETRAVEELAESHFAIRVEAPEIYRKALETLKRAGRDASEVQARLDKAAH